ncbi:MAG: M23 family metallopeptidase [Verrucomicrobiota bacterium]
MAVSAAVSPALGAADENTFVPNPVFTVSPLDPTEVREIIPLGNLSPRHGHVFPTDHIYFDYAGKAGLPVRAPAGGTVFSVVAQLVGDLKIEIRADEHLSYYLAHIVLEPGIGNGSRVKAGQVVGRASGRSSLDLGAYDTRVRLPGLINPKRYPAPTRQTVSPLSLFVEPVKSQLYAKVTRAGADKDGKIDFDRRGRLVGNWFHESLSADDGSRGVPEIFRKQLAFVYDVRKPKLVRISIGGTLAPAGTYAVPAESPDPATVGVETGLVKYPLLGPEEGSRRGESVAGERVAGPGFLLVQLVSEGRLQVEYFDKTRAEVRAFSRSALIYER